MRQWQGSGRAEATGSSNSKTTDSAKAKGKAIAKGATCNASSCMAHGLVATQLWQPLGQFGTQVVKYNLARLKRGCNVVTLAKL